MPKPQLIETRARYSSFSIVTTRFKDNDIYRHVNNAVYNVWMDTAVTEFFLQLEPELPETALVPVGAETHLNFHRSISHPAEVETGFRVEHVGNRFVRCGVGIFVRGETEASAWGHMVHVWVSRETNQAVSIPDKVRRGLESAVMQET